MTQFTKTRIAPTPSGFLHVGNALSFILTAALAKNHGSKILLRIDDIDRDRVTDAYLQDIFDTLQFLAIDRDEGPRDVAGFQAAYSQLHRMAMYQEVLDKLRQNKKVYACTCSRRQLNEGTPCNCFDKNLPLDTPNAAWRLITYDDEVSIRTYDKGAAQAMLPADMQNFVVRKKGGYPAYQLTSVADDLFYGIDLVVRGEDLWLSTIAQHVLARALDWDDFGRITFYHHPLLKEPSGEKLSKSAGAESIKYLREHGKTPADVFTLIARMLGIDKPMENRQQLADAILTLMQV